MSLATVAASTGWIAPAIVSTALVAGGIWLAPWRAFRGRSSAEHVGAHPALAAPILIGVALYLGLGFVAEDLEADVQRPLWKLLEVFVALLPAGVFAWFEDLGAKDMGVRSRWSRVGFALRAWARALPLMVGVMGLIRLVARWAGADGLGTMDELMERAAGTEFLSCAVLGIFVLPVLEESFFRGRLLARLAGHVSPGTANVLQALLFGLLHGIWAFPVLAAFGWILGRARLAGAGLGALSAVHAAHNALVFVVLAATT